MITPGEYTLLLTDEVQRAIAANRGRDPLEVALDRNTPHARLVATQVKYLARAEAKLPSYAAAQCILPPLAFEQASSEACAAHKRIAGGAVLDLTCGLGADAFFLARRFRRVVTRRTSGGSAPRTSRSSTPPPKHTSHSPDCISTGSMPTPTAVRATDANWYGSRIVRPTYSP